MVPIFNTLCQGTGVLPQVAAGIWFHETDGGLSSLWRENINPGGIKATSTFFVTVAFGTTKRGSIQYANYPNRWIAAACLVTFLHQKGYKPALLLSATPAFQIEKIAAAGYIGPGPGEPANWIAGVKKWTEEAEKLL